MNRILLMVLKNLQRIPKAYGKLCYYAKHTAEYPEETKYKHIQYIFQRAISSGNIDLQVHGTEHIPEKSGFMLYANHQGLFDILALVASCNKPIGAVLKKELYHLPLLKQMSDCTYSYPMDREDIRQSMTVIQSVTKEVQNGRNYLIFPEGTRSRNENELLEFHSGSFKCALKAQCPILPVALIDSYKVLDEKGSKPVTVQLHYLEPIAYEEYKGSNTTELATMVRSKIEAVVKKYSNFQGISGQLGIE